ncbi:hypothetical protein BYT27DRAFT_7260146 [Phlegmacium glaucopus]|nr:hypothetical protein BYT27DRAFT_7260146 [Phlegmacium glaucopus]
MDSWNGQQRGRVATDNNHDDDGSTPLTGVLRELASAYAKLFELHLCDSHGNHIADDNHQHHHSTPMPMAFDITISYEPCSDVNSDIQRACNARQSTATYIAHRFWHLMHDSPFSAEKLAEQHIPADHMDALRKLKALVPFILLPVNQYMAYNTVLESRRIHHTDLSSTFSFIFNFTILTF